MNGGDGEHRCRGGGRGEQASPKRHRIPRFDVAKPCSPPNIALLPYLTLPRLYSFTCNTAGHEIRLHMQYGCICVYTAVLDEI